MARSRPLFRSTIQWCGPLLQFGNDIQRERFLRPLASGARLAVLPDRAAGRIRTPVRSRPAPRAAGNDYVLNGSKQFITSGKNADIAIVLAVTDPRLAKRHQRLYCADQTPGFMRVAKVEEKGQRCSDTAQIVFDNCRVPVSAMLGEAGDGYRIALANPGKPAASALPRKRRHGACRL